MREIEYRRLYAAEENHWWFRAMHIFILQLLPRSSRRILDLGCGTGGFLTKLREDHEVTGLDTSRFALEHARKRGNQNLVQASANDVPFRAGFDLVISVDLLEVSTVEPNRVVQAALKSLKPGGHALFVMAAHQWLLSEHDRAVNSVRRYNVVQIRSLLKGNNTRIVRSGYLFFLLFPVMATWKLLNSSQNGEASSDVVKVPRLVNELLYWICGLEGKLLRSLSMPIGTSVFALVQKDG